MMNRAQRREYAKSIKHAKNASICPVCGKKARFFTRARGEKDTVLICEVCNNIVREGQKVTSLLVPGIYLPLSLDLFDKVLESYDPTKEKETETENELLSDSSVGENL